MKTTIYQRLKILPVLLFGFTKIFGSSFSTHFRVSPKYPSKDKDACKNKPNNVLTAWLPRSQSWICIRQSVLCQPSPQSYGCIFGHQRPDCEIPRDNFGDGIHTPSSSELTFIFGWRKLGNLLKNDRFMPKTSHFLQHCQKVVDFVCVFLQCQNYL